MSIRTEMVINILNDPNLQEAYYIIIRRIRRSKQDPPLRGILARKRGLRNRSRITYYILL